MTTTTEKPSATQVTGLTNRAFRLRRRPSGPPSGEDYELVEEAVPDLAPGQALVRTLYVSVDPTTRVWMSEYPAYMPEVPLGEVMRALGVGQVVSSRREDLPTGTLVMGFTGWQDYCVTDESTLIPPEFPFLALPDPLPAPLTAFLGVLAHTGLTAWMCIEHTRPLAGDTVVVSAASGAVGSVAGQLAKINGARVVGVSGGPEKCRHVVEDLGFDECVDRLAPDWRERLVAATPDGIDVAVENVGGEIMDAVLMRMNVGARIALSGMISGYNSSFREGPGQAAVMQFVMKRASMRGFLGFDHLDRYPEVSTHLAALMAVGRIRCDETVLEGLERAPEALMRIMDAGHVGKVVVHVADPVTT
ncbi:NADP-dependent oxidoreductase [Geodermatophilus sp. SYSU D00815]